MELNHELGNDFEKEMSKGQEDVNESTPEKPFDEEELMEDIRIFSPGGTEYEIDFTVPSHLDNYRIPHALPLYFFGPCGDMLFQKIRGKRGNAWDNWFFPKHDMIVSGVYNKPITEMYSSVLDSFETVINDQPMPPVLARQGGVFHERGVQSTAILKGGQIYHTQDVHMFPEKMEKFTDDHPLLYDLLNNAARKKPGAIPKILQVDGELQVLMHQLKNPSCAPGMVDEYCDGKINEYLMTAFWQIDRKDPHRPIILPRDSREKAIEADIYMREHIGEYIDYDLLATKMGINLNYLKRAFKEQFGRTMDEHLRKLRMETASVWLLEKPGELVIDIALDLGYESLKGFNRAFKKHFHKSPTAYRKSLLRKK